MEKFKKCEVVIVFEQAEYTVDCYNSEMTGFEIIGGFYVPEMVSTNPMAGLPFESPAGDAYVAVWGGESGWWLWQPQLPNVRYAHTVEIALWPALDYRFNGTKCVLRDANGTVVASRGNGVEFSTPEADDVVPYTVSCAADPASGFSIETATELEELPNWTHDAETGAWENLHKLLNPEEDEEDEH